MKDYNIYIYIYICNWALYYFDMLSRIVAKIINLPGFECVPFWCLIL